MLDELYEFSFSFENCCQQNQILYMSNSLGITMYEPNDIFLHLLNVPCSHRLH